MNTERFDQWLQYLARRDALYWGAFVLVLLIWTIWRYFLRERERASFYSLLAAALGWVGSLAYFAFLYYGRGVR